jgi:hypothetical protein
VACRSQDNSRCTVPDGVTPRAANLGFRRASCPRRLAQPVLGGSASEFSTTARSSAFVCSTEKNCKFMSQLDLGIVLFLIAMLKAPFSSYLNVNSIGPLNTGGC